MKNLYNYIFHNKDTAQLFLIPVFFLVLYLFPTLSTHLLTLAMLYLIGLIIYTVLDDSLSFLQKHRPDVPRDPRGTE
jgi:hypothetical protein